MKAYITIIKLLNWVERLIELDGRPIKDIAEELGYSERTFRNIRNFDRSKPTAYLNERIVVFNELADEVDANETFRIAVDGPHHEFEVLDLNRKPVPDSYRDYSIYPLKVESGGTRIIAKKSISLPASPGSTDPAPSTMFSVVETSTHDFADEAVEEAKLYIDYLEDGGDIPDPRGRFEGDEGVLLLSRGPTYLTPVDPLAVM